jgi:hypothetical protein
MRSAKTFRKVVAGSPLREKFQSRLFFMSPGILASQSGAGYLSFD